MKDFWSEQEPMTKKINKKKIIIISIIVVLLISIISIVIVYKQNEIVREWARQISEFTGFENKIEESLKEQAAI